jgi:hypothetical protein
MSLRMGALYDALRSAQGISHEDAKKAAEEVAGYENRLAGIETRLTLLTWIASTNVALTLFVLGRLLVTK